jgi:DNA-binding transcriptional ArsR family regulator
MKKIIALASLGALALETRLDIFRLLVQAGGGGVAAGEIGDRLRLALPTLSFHLAQLKHAGLVLARRQGRSIIYAANYGAMSALLAYLTENCCGGYADACAAVEAAPSSLRSSPEGAFPHEAPARARRR